MARWVVITVGVIGLLLLAGLRLGSTPAQASGQAPVAAPLSGQPVYLQAKNGVAYTLEKAEIRQLGGRSFVVGREAKDDPYKLTRPMYGDGTVWVPVDSITQLVELAPFKREK